MPLSVPGLADEHNHGRPADEDYASIRAKLETEGKPISPNDLFIAAHAYALGLTLVTANEGEFCRIEGLCVESWLA